MLEIGMKLAEENGRMGQGLLELYFEKTLNMDMVIDATEETMKKLLSLSTKYMSKGQGSGLTVTKKTKHFSFHGSIGFHYEWVNEFLELAADIDFVKFNMNIESPYTNVPEEIVYEQGTFWIIERDEVSFFEEGASDNHAFNQYKMLVLRKEPNLMDYEIFGGNLDINDLHNMLKRCNSIREFEKELVKTQTEDSESYEVVVNSFEEGDEITTTLFFWGEKLCISYDAKISTPKSEKIHLREFAKGIEDSKIPLIEERKEMIRNCSMQPAKVLYRGIQILDAVDVTSEYVNSCFDYGLTVYQQFSNDVRVLSDEKWVSPCSICVNRIKKEITGCSTCHFMKI